MIPKKTSGKLEKLNYLHEDVYEESKKWYQDLPLCLEKPSNVTEKQLGELKEEAKKCHDSESADFLTKNTKNNSTFQWMKTMMTKGTVSDKIASYTVVIQNDPVHNLELLKNFVAMVKIKKKQECHGLIDTLTELFLEDLLIPSRKLQNFHQKNVSSLNELSCGSAVKRRKILSLWYFEDQLKEIYASFINALNSSAHDSIVTTKEKAIVAMYNLLNSNSEQEKKLLSFIVNKLGDPSQKVASKAIYCLGQLLRTHSNMQSVVLNEVEKLIFRHNVSTKAQYYGLCFLSQFYLNHEESDVARRLIEVYFGFFKACVKKGEVDSRMMSALLMGVNRAYPYAKLEMNKISEHLDTIYRVVHLANFNVGLHALTLLYQVSDYANSVSDRFYSALYKKLLDPQLTTTTHQAMLLSLIYKALLKDSEITRVKALVKRLLQLCLHLTPSFTSGILYLVSQLIGKNGKLHSVILKQTALANIDYDEDEEEKYKDAEIELDVDAKKTNLSCENNHCLVSSDTKNTLTNEGMSNDAICKLKENEEAQEIKSQLKDENTSTNCNGWYHWNLELKKEKKFDSTKYNPFTRNPLYAGAEHTVYSELNYLRQHFHPTISLYATNILNGEIIKYQGDPLKDFTLIRFLDRFVFKNPKKGNELKQGQHPMFGQRKIYRPVGAKSLAVTSFNYMNSKEENIPVDEAFLYLYLNKKYRNRSQMNANDDSDMDSVASDEFEEMLEKMGGPLTDLDNDLDFMVDVGNSVSKRSKKKTTEELSEDTDEESDADIQDEENMEYEINMEEGDEELIDGLDDDDEELVFDDDSDEDKKSMKSKKGIQSLFASADEFASLLEEEGSSKKKPGGQNSLSNHDQADIKQVNWEENRQRWLTGYKNAIGKKKEYSSKGNKRRFSNKSGNKNKKFKK